MPSAATLIVIGATGDLTGRLLLPALARLWAGGDLAGDFAFVGAGPEDWTPMEFRAHAASRLTAHAADVALVDRASFVDRVDYRPVDVQDPATLGAVFESMPARNGASGGVVLYLALPTRLVATTIDALQSLTLPDVLAIAVEKPFGEDLSSATKLNAALHRLDPDDSSVFRVDHVLGLPAIAALPSLSAAVPPIPQDAQIDQVSILWDETLALEGRAAFYDRAGALKDLIQNHLLQILCMITSEPQHGSPPELGLADRRLSAMQAVLIPSRTDAVTQSRRARYTTGRLATAGGADGQVVPDYVAEPGVDANRRTETFAEVTLRVATTQWAGTRFVLRAGKAMGQRRRGILVHFRTGQGLTEQRSWIDVDEAAPADRSENSGTGSEESSTGIAWAGGAAPLEQIAYTRVLQSLLSGVFDLSVSAQESERAWEIFAPVLQAWTAEDVPLAEYTAGTSPSLAGPATRASQP